MARSALPLLVCALGVCGCHEPAPTPGEAPRAPSARSITPPRAEELDATGPVLREPRFELRIEADESYALGQEGVFRVTLRPGEGLEMETRYPYRVGVEGSEGIELPRSELTRTDAARLDAEEVRFDVPFTPRRGGTHRSVVDAEFAVCSGDGCFPMERRLAVVLSVS